MNSCLRFAYKNNGGKTYVQETVYKNNAIEFLIKNVSMIGLYAK